MKSLHFLLLASLVTATAWAQPRGNPNNQRGDNPGAQPLSPEEEQKLFHVPPGFEVELVAAEPQIAKPINLAFDGAGQLWVTCTELYPFPARTDATGKPIPEFDAFWQKAATRFRLGDGAPPPAAAGRDRVQILSDFSPEGRARRARTFADGLNIPIGVQPLPRAVDARGDTAIVFSIPAIWRLEDRDGDGLAETRRPLYTGIGFEDTHGLSSNYTYWIDGWIYGNHGHANHTEIQDAGGHRTVMDGGSTYRFRADGSRFERWTHGQTNPFGTSFDEWGNLFTADSHSKPVYRLLRGGYYEGLAKKHDGLGFAPAITKDPHGSTGIAGITYYSADQFPAEYRGNLFNGNPITQRINRDRLDWHGASPEATRLADFLTCDDPSFRPVQVKLGPDGALWIADFYNPIIGHYEVRLNHPARDHRRGRIWRVVWRGLDGSVPRPTLPNLATADAPALVATFATPNVARRTLAVNELVDRLGTAGLPRWQEQATAKLASREDVQPGEAQALASALERLDACPPPATFLAWAEAGGDRALAALHLLADRPQLEPVAEQVARVVVDRHPPGLLWLALAQVFAEHPRDWQAPLALRMLEATPENDPQLAYALRLALKHEIAVADLAQLNAWAALKASYAEILADVSLAVPKPFVADFLLAHLERNQFAGAHVAEYVKLAATSLSADRFDALCAAARKLNTDAALAQQLTVSEGLSLASHRLHRALPDDVRSWNEGVVLRALAASDPKLVERGLEASAGSTSPAFRAAWRKIALDRRATGPIRASALQLFPPDSSGRLVAMEALRAHPEPRVLEAAAALLGEADAGEAAQAALADAFVSAPPDQALTIATALAKTDSGAGQLLQLAESGRASPRLLVRSGIASAFAARSAPIQARFKALTAALPSESVRLDQVIAERAANYRPSRTDVVNGAKVFTMNCAPCHRYHDTGGSVGPSLDGIGVRGAPRLFEDILDPSRNIDPAFRRTTLKTVGGEEIVGCNYQATGETVTLTDLTGKVVTFPRAQIAAARTEDQSIMPPVFENSIQSDDLADLIAYLIGKEG